MTCVQCGNFVASGYAACPSCGSENPAPPSYLSGQQAGPSWGLATGFGSQAYNFDPRRWQRSDRTAGIASLVVLISLFLPWFSTSFLGAGISLSGTYAHGWLWLVFIVALAILGYLALTAGYEVLPVKSPLRHDQLLLTAMGVNAALVFIGFLLEPAGFSYGGGAFLGLIAAIAAVASVTSAGRQMLDSGAS